MALNSNVGFYVSERTTIDALTSILRRHGFAILGAFPANSYLQCRSPVGLRYCIDIENAISEWTEEEERALAIKRKPVCCLIIHFDPPANSDLIALFTILFESFTGYVVSGGRKITVFEKNDIHLLKSSTSTDVPLDDSQSESRPGCSRWDDV
jgi:hypothetical protein